MTVVDGLQENGVNGSLFLQLSREDLKELMPRIANRIALRQIQSTVRKREGAECLAVGSICRCENCRWCDGIRGCYCYVLSGKAI